MSKSRLEAFTDAIIAIIMTILVLEIAAPLTPSWDGLWALRHKILVYAISFFLLGIYWKNHHHLFQIVHKVNGRILWSNSVFLFVLSFFPLATSWIGEFLNAAAPALFYGIIILVTNIAYYHLARQLERSDPENYELQCALAGHIQSKITIGINCLALLLGLWLPVLIILFDALSFCLWLIPNRRIEQIFTAPKEKD
ncbi:MAG: TMEM175 family protein [Christensenellaceae bacterium]|jgi:uncharacterized membrane protein